MRTSGANMAGKDGDKMLRRIIAILLSLATLAERAAATYYPVRFLVLLLLRPAEARARGFVCDLTDTPPFDLSAFPSDSSPNGALHLALCFRMLAAILQDMLCEPQHFAPEIRRRFTHARPVMRDLTGGSPVVAPRSRAPPLPVS